MRLAVSFALLAAVSTVASAQSTDHPQSCDHQSSDCVYNTFRVKAHAARKKNDLSAMVEAARYGVRLFRRDSKAIQDRTQIVGVLNVLLRIRETQATTAAEKQAKEDANQLLGQHYGWKLLAGKWRDPDDVREVMGWEKHGSRWWPKEAWTLERQIKEQRRLVKRKISDTGGDVSGLEAAEQRLAQLEERRQKLAGQRRQAEANQAKANKDLPQRRVAVVKAKKALEANDTPENKRALQTAEWKLRAVRDDLMLEEARLKDLKTFAKRIPREIKKAKKDLRKARKKLGPGYRKVAPALKKLDQLVKQQAAVQAKAEAEFNDAKLLEQRLKAHDKTKK